MRVSPRVEAAHMLFATSEAQPAVGWPVIDCDQPGVARLHECRARMARRRRLIRSAANFESRSPPAAAPRPPMRGLQGRGPPRSEPHRQLQPQGPAGRATEVRRAIHSHAPRRDKSRSRRPPLGTRPSPVLRRHSMPHSLAEQQPSLRGSGRCCCAVPDRQCHRDFVGQSQTPAQRRRRKSGEVGGYARW